LTNCRKRMGGGKCTNDLFERGELKSKLSTGEEKSKGKMWGIIWNGESRGIITQG